MINAFMEPVNSITLPISPGLFGVAFLLICIVIASLVLWRNLQGTLGLERWPLVVVLPGFVVWLFLFLILLAGIFGIIGASIHEMLTNPSPNWLEFRWSLLTITALTAALSATVALPFTLRRTQFNSRQTIAIEQGLITDRINSAVQGLGTERIVKVRRKSGKNYISVEQSEPNMEVRIGSIYALARIARENLSFHVQIMQILCAYVRENSKAEGAVPFKMPEMPGETGDLQQPWQIWRSRLWEYIRTFKQGLKPKTDIQTVLAVLGRRTPEQQAREAGWPHSDKDGVFVFATIPVLSAYPNNYDPATHAVWAKQMAAFKSDVGDRFRAYTGYRLDLRNTNLQGYDLRELNFRGTRFDFAQMQAADLTGAQIQGADLWNAGMQGGRLSSAQMQGANLEAVRIQGTNLTEAQMQGASLGFAQMQGAGLGAAQLQGASLIGVQMQGASLTRVQMQGADLNRALLQAANLSRAQMQGAELITAQMSKKTILTDAVLKGVLVKSVDETTIEKLRPFWTDIFADGTVVMPEGERPAHWPTEKLKYSPWDPEHSTFDIEYHKWLSNPASFPPPKPGTPD
jgi:uncharacterized protein YjbI with pentapeptide repeats